MEVKLRLLFKGIFVILVLIKELNCYPFNGFYGCRDVFIWFQGEIVSCKYLMFPSRHGLHMDPKYYCTEYTAHRCCETCALLDRHNYRVINGVYRDSTTNNPTTTDIYDYMRVNEIYRAPSIDLPAHSDVIRYKVFNNVNKKTTTPAPAPPLLKSNNYHVLNNVNTENITVMSVAVDKSNKIVVNNVNEATTSIPATTRNADVYRVTKRKSTHITLFTIPNVTIKGQPSTTVKPQYISNPVTDSNLYGSINETVQVNISESRSNVLSNVTQTVQPYQYMGQTVEQFFTIPPNTSQTEQVRSTTQRVNQTYITKTTKMLNALTTLFGTTAPSIVTSNASTSFNSTYKTTPFTSIPQKTTLLPTTQKPNGQKKLIRDGCIDIGIWVVNGSVPCDYLVKDNKYGLNRNQLYFCNRYPLTSCCDTCKRINHEFGHVHHKEESTTESQQIVSNETPNLDVNNIDKNNIIVDATAKERISTDLPTSLQDSTVLSQRQTTVKHTGNIQTTLPNTIEREQHYRNDIKQWNVKSENVIAKSQHPIALPLRQNVERTTARTTSINQRLQGDDLITLGSTRTYDKVTTKVPNVDIGLTKPTLPALPDTKTVPTYETATQQQNTYFTTSQTTTSKAPSKKRCVDVGIWFRSGSVSCDYLIKDHKYKLNKNPLYFCKSYPLTSCCKTCALIDLIINS